MDYEIIATLGPASNQPGCWQAMIAAGATSFRLNTSHLTMAGLWEWLDRLSPWMNQDRVSHLVLDLQGSKWRLGNFVAFDLVNGSQVQLVCAAESSHPGVLPVPHADFFSAAGASNGEIVLNDAKSRLRIEPGGQSDSLVARVETGGRISAHKGITLAESQFRQEALSEKDQAILNQTRALGWVRYAVSYVKDGPEMLRYRQWTGEPVHLSAKLERISAVRDVEAIAQSADGLWMCRGDLGAEAGLVGMAHEVAHFSARVNQLPVPSIMAGQVLEHLTEHPLPTRSEVCYLLDTLQKGYRGFVLSDETAIGRDPVGAVRFAALFKPAKL